MSTENNKNPTPAEEISSQDEKDGEEKPIKEIGGPKGPEPTRYGDWEKKGRCIDF